MRICHSWVCLSSRRNWKPFEVIVRFCNDGLSGFALVACCRQLVTCRGPKELTCPPSVDWLPEVGELGCSAFLLRPPRRVQTIPYT